MRRRRASPAVRLQAAAAAARPAGRTCRGARRGDARPAGQRPGRGVGGQGPAGGGAKPGGGRVSPSAFVSAAASALSTPSPAPLFHRSPRGDPCLGDSIPETRPPPAAPPPPRPHHPAGAPASALGWWPGCGEGDSGCGASRAVAAARGRPGTSPPRPHQGRVCPVEPAELFGTRSPAER